MEQTKRLKAERDQKRAAKRDATPGREEAGTDAGIGPQMDNDIVMPMFPLWLGQMLTQHTDYSEIDVLEQGSIFLREEMSDSELTE